VTLCFEYPELFKFQDLDVVRETQYPSAGSSGDGQEVATATVPAVFRVGSGTTTFGQSQAAASYTGKKWPAELLHSAPMSPHERALNVSRACSRVSRPQSDLSSIHYTPHFVDAEHNLTMCMHAKSASTYLVFFLFELNGKNISKFGNKYDFHVGVRSHWGADGRKSAQELGRHHTMQVVRHPFQRFVSSYVDKIVVNEYFSKRNAYGFVKDFKGLPVLLKNNLPITLWNINGTSATIESKAHLHDFLNNYDLQAAKRGAAPEYGKYLSFPQFTQYALKQLLQCKDDPVCLKKVDVHIQPQWVRCDPCSLRYDTILKAETLNTEMDYVREVLQLPNLDATITKNMEIRNSRISADSTPPKKLKSQSKKGKNKADTPRATASGKSEPEKQPSKKGPKINSSAGAGLHHTTLLQQLSPLERDLLYTAYRLDFDIFGYQT